MENLLKRTITGIILVFFVMGGFLLHPISFFLVGLVIISGMLLELSGLVSGREDTGHFIKSLFVSVPIYILAIAVAFGILSKTFLLFAILPLIIIPVAELFRKGDSHINSVATILFSSLYTTVPYILVIFSASGTDGFDTLLNHGLGVFSPVLAVGFFILIWINDTGAYLVGITFGRHRLFERISPKKTWEGFAGGLIISMIISWYIGGLLGSYSRLDWMIVAGLTVVGSTLGDLFESLIKREAGVKDSGSILPGHGGFLDRFDGVTFSFPMVYLYITFFG